MITVSDFNTHIYAELINAISRDNPEILMSALDAAVQEVKGYLGRYNTQTLFSAAGGNRDSLLLMVLKDVASWHFIALANANIDLELRKTRYDDAINRLKDIQSGKVVYPDWPLADTDEPSSGDNWQVGSRTKRNTHY